MLELLERINARLEPWEFYTARELRMDAHTSERMLAFRLEETIDASLRSGICGLRQ